MPQSARTHVLGDELQLRDLLEGLHPHHQAELRVLAPDIPALANRACHIVHTGIAPLHGRTGIADILGRLQEVIWLAELAVCLIDAGSAARNGGTGEALVPRCQVVPMIARQALAAIVAEGASSQSLFTFLTCAITL